MLSSGHLPVSGGHSIYYQTYGKRDGRPAVVLHGGPGGGSNPGMTKIYDLTKWFVVLFDQRGCGKSTPFLCLKNNTTHDLIEDIEALREHFGVKKWFVSGGSWGTTLALAYAESHPSKVTGLLLRGVCFGNDDTQKWLYEKGGVSEIYPEGWKLFTSVLPKALHDKGWRQIIKYYQKHLQGKDARKFANAWWGWEASVSHLVPQKNTYPPSQCLSLAVIENHYFTHDCWFTKEQIFKNLYKLKNIPISIVHGRYDVVCPITQAFAIKWALPHTKLHVVTEAGHAGSHPLIMKGLKEATRRMVNKTRKQ